MAFVRAINVSDMPARFGCDEDSAPSTEGIFSVGPGDSNYLEAPIASDQSMNYRLQAAPTSGGAYIDVYGYVYQR